MTIKTGLSDVREKIEKAIGDSAREPGSVALIAVTKTKPQAAVREALEAGHRIFGENRVQEAETKFPDLKAAFPDLELHLIGPLQSNKTKDAVALFDVIHTVDRAKLIRRLVAAMAQTGRRPTCLVQVNTGSEAQKAGVEPADLPGLLAEAVKQGLKISGLMCIPPAGEPAQPHFAFLHKLAGQNGLAGGILSMGMSGDFEEAVMLGATHVRVGSALFGARPPV